MPSSVTAKTASAHNRLLGLVFGTIVFSILIVLALSVWIWRVEHTVLQINGQKYYLQVARSPRAQYKGLGGRRSLPPNQGMLFAFSHPGTQCFWMKDMRFPLDIVWLNSQKQILFIASNVPVNSYPTAYCPQAAAQYVIELNAGQAAYAGMYRGETLTF